MKNLGYTNQYPETDHFIGNAVDDLDVSSNKIERLQPRFTHFFELGKTSHFILRMPQKEIELGANGWLNFFSEESDEFSEDNILSIIHPKDLRFYLECESESLRFFGELSQEDLTHYKTRFDFRIKRNGIYKRFVQQWIVLEPSPEVVLRFLVITTDISQLKRSSSSRFSILNTTANGDPISKYITSSTHPSPLPFSRREHEIFVYLMQNLSSKEIASKLYVTEDTVRGHRKRMLKKANCKNTLGLIMTSFENGWI